MTRIGSPLFVVDDRSKLLPATVGPKLANLAALHTAGFAVPPYFCLTRHSYEAAVSALRPQVRTRFERCHSLDAVAVRSASRRIQRLFLEVRLPDGLEEAIMASFEGLFEYGEYVAVRASMVGQSAEESEDSAHNPMAGMSDSFLFVGATQLVGKIRRCWASGYSPEAITYRQRLGFAPHGFSVAVGVQRMIASARSVVVFSCDPRTTQRQTVISAGYGVGAGVVQERVGVDHYFVNQKSKVITTEIGSKTTKLVRNPDGDGSSLVAEPVAAEAVKKPCLTTREILELDALAQKVEGLFGSPQDIEGAYDSKGRLYLLQSRPVHLDHRTIRVWSSANVSESFPNVTTPMTYSMARLFYRTVFYDFIRRSGCPPDLLYEQLPDFERMLGFIKGRVYHSLTYLLRVNGMVPIAKWFMSDLEDVLEMPASIARNDSGGGGPWAMFRASMIAGLCAVRLGREFREFETWWRNYLGELRQNDLDGADPMVAVVTFREVWKQAGRWWGLTLINHWLLNTYFAAVRKLIKKWNLEISLSDLLCGEENAGTRAITSTIRIAEFIRADSRSVKLFEAMDDQAVWSAILTEPDFRELRGFVQRHLQRYGDRGVAELNMEAPSFRREPKLLVRTLRSYVSKELVADELAHSEKQICHRAEEQVRAALGRRSIRSYLFLGLIRRLRVTINRREDSRFWRGELFGYCKDIIDVLARSLVKHGALDRSADAVFLTHEEMLGFFEGTGITGDLQALVGIRRREKELHELGAGPPRDFTTCGPVQPAIPQDGSALGTDRILRGIGSSAGVVEGRARIVLDPTNVSVEANDILVARETDPGWLFLMLAGRGIVVERGSMLSHTAISGRKFGIPTVVGVPDAMRVIPEGARIRLDGAGGTVTIVER